MCYYEYEDDIAKDFKIVWGAIHKYGFDATEDNFQIGCIGLLKASRKFNPNKNFKFTTFAYRCIANEIYMYYRSKSRVFIDNHCVSLDEMIYNNALQLGSYDEALEIESDLRDIVSQAIDRACTEESKAIFHDVCTKRMNGEPVTQTQIAQTHRISPTKVSRSLRKIKKEVKSILVGNCV